MEVAKVVLTLSVEYAHTILIAINAKPVFIWELSTSSVETVKSFTASVVQVMEIAANASMISTFNPLETTWYVSNVEMDVKSVIATKTA